MATSPFRQSEEVEVFLNAEPGGKSGPPLILPSNAASKVTAAQRRWNLLQNLMTVSRRPTSLTKSEETFLQNFKRIPKEAQKADGGAEEDGRLQKARLDLNAAIRVHANALTEREIAFLTQLAHDRNVTSQYLEQSAQVLSKDPLFLKAEQKKEAQEDRGAKEAAKALRLQGPSFRTEVWTHFKSSSDCVGSMSSPEEIIHEKKEEEPIKRAKPKSALYKIIFRKKKKQKELRKEEEATTDDDGIDFSILATSVNDVDCHPHVLSPPIMEALRLHLPPALQYDNFWLKYSMVRDGASMRCLLQKIRSSCRTVIAIETMGGEVFGAFTSSPWRPRGHGFYGSCEAFLWRMSKSRYTECETVDEAIALESGIDVFPWSSKNRNIQFLATADSKLIVGGGAPDNDGAKSDSKSSDDDDDDATGSGIVICADMVHGFSDPCVTFNCPGLLATTTATSSSSGSGGGGGETSFEILNLEAWALTPVGDVQMAEKLELGRQFIFDYGNFVED